MVSYPGFDVRPQQNGREARDKRLALAVDVDEKPNQKEADHKV
jgi:hypothetical protein